MFTYAGAQSFSKRERKFEAQYYNLEEISSEIQKSCEKLLSDTFLIIEGEHVYATQFIPEFYKSRNYQPAWNEYEVFIELLKAVEGVEANGLLPEDYHISAIDSLEQKIVSNRKKDQYNLHWVAEFDLLITDALFTYAYHLLYGKTNPLTFDASWNFNRKEFPPGMVDSLTAAIEKRDIVQRLKNTEPSFTGYSKMKDALALYKYIAQNGGWGTIKSNQVLKRGESSEVVPQIRKRLLLTGDLTDTLSIENSVYDDSLYNDIKRFQKIHGLNNDGVIGKNTYAIFNIPVEKKIELLKVNMERNRWVSHAFSDDFILVNIAAFEAYVFDNKQRIHTTKTMVGKTYHQTPIFTAKLDYVEFNPTWTVPTSIFKREMIAKIKADSNYLSRNHLEVITFKGEVVDASTLNFNELTPSTSFPYMLRQKPGPWNALGQVKFIFPNKFSVFLHDTPSRSLFAREDRSLSHGCIRVENPLNFAEVVLRETEYTNEKINEIIKNEETHRVLLDSKPDVMLLYLTVSLGENGDLRFFKDVYNRDQKVYEALKKGKIHTIDVLPF